MWNYNNVAFDDEDVEDEWETWNRQHHGWLYVGLAAVLLPLLLALLLLSSNLAQPQPLKEEREEEREEERQEEREEAWLSSDSEDDEVYDSF